MVFHLANLFARGGREKVGVFSTFYFRCGIGIFVLFVCFYFIDGLEGVRFARIDSNLFARGRSFSELSVGCK